MQRRHFKNILSFPDRLDQEAARLRAEAEKRTVMSVSCLCARSAKVETAMHVDEWVSSPGLQAPK